VSTDTYQSWVERIAGGREGKPLGAGEEVTTAAGEPFGAIEFVKIQKKGFLAEVGKKGDNFIFHFFPEEPLTHALVYQFVDPINDAFIEIFKETERIEGVWEDDMTAYAVRALGFVSTMWGDEQALRVIDVAEQKIIERQGD
jgi:hypothetical protein